jgi:hypothetical protein
MRYVFRSMANGDVIELRRLGEGQSVRATSPTRRRGDRVPRPSRKRNSTVLALQKPVSRPLGLALRLILPNGVRPGEAAGTSRAELDRRSEKERARWTIPAARSKNGRANLARFPKWRDRKCCRRSNWPE